MNKTELYTNLKSALIRLVVVAHLMHYNFRQTNLASFSGICNTKYVDISEIVFVLFKYISHTFAVLPDGAGILHLYGHVDDKFTKRIKRY